jgi:hypothetical protein
MATTGLSRLVELRTRIMSIEHDDGEWLAQTLDALRPGWRGRLQVKVPDEMHTGEVSEIIGTVVDEPAIERDPEGESAGDAFVMVCANYHDGRFMPTAGEPRVAVRASHIVGVETM